MQEFTGLWSAPSTAFAPHHASVLSMLSQIIQNNHTKTKPPRFVSSDYPHRGTRAVEVEPCTCRCSAKDLTDYENRLNFVRMELEHVNTLPIKSVTSGTHLITRQAQPRWPCNSIGG
jgi:hypothetical protein